MAAFEILDEGVTEDAVPSIEIGQLLRSFAQVAKKAAMRVSARHGWSVDQSLAAAAGDW